jgi:hypothetical protein
MILQDSQAPVNITHRHLAGAFFSGMLLKECGSLQKFKDDPELEKRCAGFVRESTKILENILEGIIKSAIPKNKCLIAHVRCPVCSVIWKREILLWF